MKSLVIRDGGVLPLADNSSEQFNSSDNSIHLTIEFIWQFIQFIWTPSNPMRRLSFHFQWIGFIHQRNVIEISVQILFRQGKVLEYLINIPTEKYYWLMEDVNSSIHPNWTSSNPMKWVNFQWNGFIHFPIQSLVQIHECLKILLPPHIYWTCKRKVTERQCSDIHCGWQACIACHGGW